VDDSEPYAEALLAKHMDNADPNVELYQGGTFVAAELGGDPSRALPEKTKGRGPRAEGRVKTGARGRAKKPATRDRKRTK
jgi:hypothetical protein